ncbi:MAG: hypothetical protein GEV08_03395 [Acidimicrobiia bacterium]|nr:hypothetical protein [Acidimicrobiia bacterium]
MRLATRSLPVGLGALGLVVAWAEPAGAHGFGGEGVLPFASWQLAWSAGAVVAATFALLGATWSRPRLVGAAVGRPLPAAFDRAAGVAALVGRAVALAVLALLLATAMFGPARGASNVAPLLLYLTFWIAFQVLSPLVGDLWGAVSPLDSLAGLVPGRRPGGPVEPAPQLLSQLLAPAGLLGLAWLELAYHAPGSPRVIGWLTVAYVVGQLGLVARFGRGWLGQGESFTVYFALLASLAPFHRDTADRLRLRPPVAGLATVAASPVLLGVVVSTLGAVAYDGLSRLPWWLELTADRRGWSLTLVNTIGLAWMVAVVAALYLGAARASAWLSRRDPDEVARAFAPTLVPLAVSLTAAHYVWPVVFDGQALLVQLSDPFAKGWDLLGTADWYINYTLVSPAQVAWVQLACVLVGHMAAVVALFDRGLEREQPDVARRALYPLLGLLVASAVVGMLLVLTA